VAAMERCFNGGLGEAFAHTEGLTRIVRYETAIDRTFKSSLHELKALQEARFELGSFAPSDVVSIEPPAPGPEPAPAPGPGTVPPEQPQSAEQPQVVEIGFASQQTSCAPPASTEKHFQGHTPAASQASDTRERAA
ncbi:MAG: hypothetical protein HYZ57_14675, partial [Acidobacteria bacterium]|nr:hypothetical protein [Acidobacteriota bacterium]